jgi:hypothetical protein
MSERFYTTLTVSGPDAVTAKKVAIQALKDLSKDDKPMRWSNELTPEEQAAEWVQWNRGFWYDEETVDEWEKGARDGSKITHDEAEEYRRRLRDGEETPHFFDHDSGQSAIFALIYVATKFPTEKFVLWVNGSFGEGIQGPFTIADGGATLIDGRSEEISYGDERPRDTFLEMTATGELREIGRENKLVWWLRKMRYLVHRTFRIVIYNFRPRITVTHYVPQVRDEVDASDDISMEEVLGAGTHKRHRVAD